ncbi:hypothetical protein M427DRAFT_134803 [Gonapodya prolifera JEL478]|uniref:Fluoroacetyl-CoA-specific thioesterase-like domain-containing protein n=1 Tax=Gonapodya prolifera (strain JEL478) TaxID=1344416 RepID=A0A139AH70_GONPJ|nr:hypothetical protein M427DRAFT_134803 [Gonapodya prolifera JEL478]|eukprot:KXS16049.1 hypothetical protein M427DRAFT_134803 [Gonapodya prolifera JEL478]
MAFGDIQIPLGVTGTASRDVTRDTLASATETGGDSFCSPSPIVLMSISTHVYGKIGPMVVALFEKAAFQAVKQYLPAKYTTVGLRVDFSHLAGFVLLETFTTSGHLTFKLIVTIQNDSSSLSSTVTVTAKLVRFDSLTHGVLEFEVEARDASELLARGRHQRAVVDRAAFARRMERKRAAHAAGDRAGQSSEVPDIAVKKGGASSAKI